MGPPGARADDRRRVGRRRRRLDRVDRPGRSAQDGSAVGGLVPRPRSATAAAAPSPTLSDACCCKGVLGDQLAAGQSRPRRGVRARAGQGAARRPLDLTLERVVSGMVEIAQANMANAVRSVSIWKGLDPRDLTLVAFGGAGGMVAGRGRPDARHPARARSRPCPGNSCAMGPADDRLPGGRRRSRSSSRADEVGPRRAQRASRRTADATLDHARRARASTESDIVAVATSRTSATTARSTSCRSRSKTFPSPRRRSSARSVASRTPTRRSTRSACSARASPRSVSLRVIARGALPQYELGRVHGRRAGIAPKSESREVLDGDATWSAVDVYDRYDAPGSGPRSGSGDPRGGGRRRSGSRPT